LIFWDYATAAPYVKMDMNPSSTAYKDGIFISAHKLIGGPGTPGKISKSEFILFLVFFFRRYFNCQKEFI
jgi:selenocysteine lyase/cysteine desulfurase